MHSQWLYVSSEPSNFSDGNIPLLSSLKCLCLVWKVVEGGNDRKRGGYSQNGFKYNTQLLE